MSSDKEPVRGPRWAGLHLLLALATMSSLAGSIGSPRVYCLLERVLSMKRQSVWGVFAELCFRFLHTRAALTGVGQCVAQGCVDQRDEFCP